MRNREWSISDFSAWRKTSIEASVESLGNLSGDSSGNSSGSSSGERWGESTGESTGESSGDGRENHWENSRENSQSEQTSRVAAGQLRFSLFWISRGFGVALSASEGWYVPLHTRTPPPRHPSATVLGPASPLVLALGLPPDL